jgi:hypothetical protein
MFTTLILKITKENAECNPYFTHASLLPHPFLVYPFMVLYCMKCQSLKCVKIKQYLQKHLEQKCSV